MRKLAEVLLLVSFAWPQSGCASAPQQPAPAPPAAAPAAPPVPVATGTRAPSQIRVIRFSGPTGMTVTYVDKAGRAKTCKLPCSVWLEAGVANQELYFSMPGGQVFRGLAQVPYVAEEGYNTRIYAVRISEASVQRARIGTGWRVWKTGSSGRVVFRMTLALDRGGPGG